MTIDELESKIKAAGYPEIKRASSTRLVIYTSDNRVIALTGLAKELEGTYTTSRTGTGWKSSVGAVIIENYAIIAKPLTKGTGGNISSLDARVFCKLGNSTKFNYLNSDVSVAMFTNANQLRDSILKGCKESPLLGEAYVEMISSFFETGKIDWNPEVSLAVINKLGVYLGELLVGWVLLANKKSTYFKTNPFTGTPKAFYLPTDPAFSGVDSFVVMANGTMYGISSKFGKGAKASIFTNLLKNGIEKETSLKPSVFKDLCKTAKMNGLKYSNSRSIVYEYGIRNILQMPKSVIPSPDAIYAEAYKKSKDANLKKVVDAINASPYASADIKKNLPSSISSFFNRTIADKLNKDADSLSSIEEILTGKDYWQTNLDIAKWKNGEVSFSFVRSSKAKIKIIGSKSSIPDITSKQGWINYELS